MNLKFSTIIERECSIVTLSGKILSDGDIEGLSNHIDQLTNWKVIFDLSKLSHINSSGISVFVKTMTKCRINHGDLIITNPNKMINQLFEITKMNEVFSIHDSNEAAINQFK
jgi:anti-sigma B factor antagonist|tara:strand:+ start:3499 stop:3834 length:336 start_codon:yes stop_codon:yes gene_type:complete